MGRRLGQHFLFDPAILDRIVDALDPSPNDLVLEIGSGKGTLTAVLATRVGRVVAVEKDERLARELQGRCQGAGVRGQEIGDRVSGIAGDVAVVHGDALRSDWSALVAQHASPRQPTPAPQSPVLGRPFKLIGNIPYYITSPLIDKALTPPLPTCIVFLIQKEVAERLAAPPGGKAYGALSVGVQAMANVERLFAVRRGAFRPPPAIDSAVVRITPRAVPPIAPEESRDFRAFVQRLFGRRRKQISGILRTVAGREPMDVAHVLERLQIGPAARPETLPVPTIVALYRAFREPVGPGSG